MVAFLDVAPFCILFRNVGDSNPGPTLHMSEMSICQTLNPKLLLLELSVTGIVAATNWLMSENQYKILYNEGATKSNIFALYLPFYCI